MPDFSSMLKYFRERENLSQRELAAKLGMSASTICMYETGKRHPKFEDEEAIADFFNVDLNTLRGRQTIETDLDPSVVNKAIQYYELYSNASPEVQMAVEILLRNARPKK